MSGPEGAASASFDARPLIEPVDRAAVREFARRLRSEGRVPPAFGGPAVVVAIVVGVFFVTIFGGVFMSTLSTFVGFALTAGNGEGAWFAVIIAVVPLVVMGGILALVIVGVVKASSTRSERWYRLERFAGANGLSYQPVLQNPPLPGMIFGLGSARQSTDLVRGDRPRFVEISNYRYTTGSGKNRTTHQWSYVAIRLDVPLPNIVLDATGNNALFGSNLPASFGHDQRLRLEGDFDEHFALYCPAGYETDALYLFTPDIMARFIDHAAALDVEIVDDWLFLYSRRELSGLDPAMWAWMFSVVGALLDKFAQWARWRDDRLAAQALASGTDAATAALIGGPASGSSADAAAGAPHAAAPFLPPAMSLRPPPGVAQPGRRLTRRVPWAGVLVVAGFLVLWALLQYGGLAWLVGSLTP